MDLDYSLKSCIHPSHEYASKQTWMHIVESILPKHINQSAGNNKILSNKVTLYHSWICSVDINP